MPKGRKFLKSWSSCESRARRCSSPSVPRRDAAMAMPICRYVFAAAEQVAQALTDYAVIVTKSTVPVGTSRRIVEIVRQARPDLEFDVASNPEFLREGQRHQRLHAAGSRGHRHRKRPRPRGHASAVPAALPDRGDRSCSPAIETAELTKYAANAFLAMKVTFINEIADLCERVGADVHDVARGIGLDGRIGRKFLHPGPGYGGSCFPKDTAGAGPHRTGCWRTVRGWSKRPSRSTTPASRSMAMRVISACGGIGARQNHRRSRPDLQAGDRRHARCAVAVDHRPPGRRRGDHPRFRSRRAWSRRRPLLPDAITYCADASMPCQARTPWS